MPVFHLLNGQGSGQNVDIGAGDAVIGQGGGAGIILPDDWISWEHARISVEKGIYYLEDLGSTNGTFVNCLPIDGKVPIQHKDVVFFGRTHALFLVDDYSPPSLAEEEAFTFAVDSDEAMAGDFELLDFDDLDLD